MFHGSNMKHLLCTLTALGILFNSFQLRAALEDAESDHTGNKYDDEYNLADESTLKANESLEGDDVTTLQYPLPKIGEIETKAPQILDPDECGDPPFVKNAIILDGKQSRYEVGAKTTYACEFGYITDGSVHFSECLLSDTTGTLYWTNPEIRCSPRSCGDPGYVAHAHREGSVFTFPNKVSFECDDGYSMQGYGTRYCQTSGTWSGKLPSCDPIFCEPPANPENGKVSFSSLGFESELRYECNPGFILRNDHGRICSANGTWSGSEPVCIEEKCDPPVAPEYGTVQVIGDKSSVGSMALYTCGEGRVLIGSASSRCLDIGQWTFPTPKCVEPCFVPKVEHGKIGKYVRYYRQRRFEELPEKRKIEDFEELYLRCEPNYETFGNPNTEEKITCAHGEWVAFPVCTPAMCRGPAPPTDNADVARADRTHGGGVIYLCKPYSKKVRYGTTTCHFGTWVGKRPVCKDMRCSVDALSFPGLKKTEKQIYMSGQSFVAECERGFNLTKEHNALTCTEGTWKDHLPPCIAASCSEQDLVETEGILADAEKLVLNGEYLRVRCKEGHSPSGKQARCSRGQWTVTGPLCQESECSVHAIEHGGFSEEVQKKQWNFSSWRFDQWRIYQRVRLGGTKSPGSSMHVSCDNRYTFQASGSNNVLVTCSKGKWNPDPVCLITGTPYKNEAKPSREKTENSYTSTSGIPPATSEPLLTTRAKPDEDTKPTPYPSCSCTYRGIDDSLVAYVGTERLSYGDKVKEKDKIKFHCRHLGYSRLNGVSEIKCENCRSWHSSEFPECVGPRAGDTILHYEGDFTILPGGVVGVQEGKRLSVRCVSNGITDYPLWATSVSPELKFKSYRDGGGRFVSVLNISHVASEHNGQYLCYMNGYRASTFDFQVISASPVTCSKFDDDEYIVHYENGQSVNSSAVFTCKDAQKKTDGPSVVTCLLNGQWSGSPPKCKISTTCQAIAEREGITVSYTRGLDVGSIAAFHCLEPRVRDGVAWATCKRSGQWSDPPATCELPSCSLEQLFEVVPENVVPVMENVTSDTLPFNFSLPLTCDDNLMISGSDVAKCGQGGRWQVSKVQCISGCVLPLTHNFELVIEPAKSFYRFGESVSLSCSPGFVLSSEVVRLMCLGSVWSETVLPTCLKE